MCSENPKDTTDTSDKRRKTRKYTHESTTNTNTTDDHTKDVRTTDELTNDTNTTDEPSKISTTTVEPTKPRAKKNTNSKDKKRQQASQYGAQNSSTAMILLNNRSKRSRLKRTKITKSAREKSNERKLIDPTRHSRELLLSSQLSLHHQRCFESDTPKFKPLIVPNFSWEPRSRSSSTLHIVTKVVNPRRHRLCMSTSEASFSSTVDVKDRGVRPKSLDIRFPSLYQ